MLPVLQNPASDESSEPNEKQSCIEKKLAIRTYSMKLTRLGIWKRRKLRLLQQQESVGPCNERRHYFQMKSINPPRKTKLNSNAIIVFQYKYQGFKCLQKVPKLSLAKSLSLHTPDAPPIHPLHPSSFLNKKLEKL